MNGVFELLLITLGLGIVMAVIQRALQRPDQIRALKQRQADIKKRLELAKKASDKVVADQAMTELLKVSQEQLKLNMRHMLPTTVIFLAAFAWLGAAYAGLQVAMPFALPFLGSQLNWFWWYVAIIIPAVQIFRKVFGVE